MNPDMIALLRQKLKLQAYNHGPRSPEAARAYFDLGSAYSKTDEFENAERALNSACEIYEQLGMPEELAEATNLLNDIKFYLTGEPVTDSSDDLAALTLSHFNVPVYVRTPDAVDGEKPGSYVENVKGFLTEEARQPAEALSPEEVKRRQEAKALDDAINLARIEVSQMKKKGSRNTSQLADLLVELATMYSRKNEPENMEAALVEALSIRETVYGKNHLSVSTDLKNLGRLYFATERYTQAEQSWKRALEIRETMLGPFHPQVADISDLFAKLLRKVNRVSEAEELEARIEESKTRHKSDWDAFRKTALKAMEEGNYFYAQALWLAALDEASDFEEDDPRILTTLENLAHVYWKRRKYEKSEPLCKRIYKISERLLGKDHLDVARAANNLALVCERQGKFTEAAVLYKEVIRVMEQTLGQDHADVLATKESHTHAITQSHKQLEQKLQKTKF
ncbi:MAG: tetratricopeptide repeat protein [Candidatus Obscuribacterales bacterium]|nr:tetratricopeptide repeat protein [Candidatus Obscuribacterales bacterium]